MSAHLSAEVLSRYLNAALSEDETARVESHASARRRMQRYSRTSPSNEEGRLVFIPGLGEVRVWDVPGER